MTYALLTENLTSEGVEQVDEMLTEAYDHELTKQELRRRTAKRRLQAKGALSDQAGLLSAMTGARR